jgi:nitrogen fixation protein FixH
MDNTASSGTPPVLSDLVFRQYVGTEVDYSLQPDITSWEEGTLILGLVKITDPDLDVTEIKYTCTRNVPEKTRTSFSFITQDRNPYGLGFSVDLDAGTWIVSLTAHDGGNNSSEPIEKTVVITPHQY